MVIPKQSESGGSSRVFNLRLRTSKESDLKVQSPGYKDSLDFTGERVLESSFTGSTPRYITKVGTFVIDGPRGLTGAIGNFRSTAEGTEVSST